MSTNLRTSTIKYPFKGPMLGAWKKGIAAAKDGKPRNACPYDGRFSRMVRGFQRAWQAGWDQENDESDNSGN